MREIHFYYIFSKSLEEKKIRLITFKIQGEAIALPTHVSLAKTQVHSFGVDFKI